MRLIRFILLLFLFSSCSPRIPANTGIEGQVLIGPMCPVVQQGQECPDQPYQATMTILTSEGRKVTQFNTDADGRFRLPLAPGNYILHPQTSLNQPMSVAVEQPFSVVEGQFTQIKVTFDSGIR
jgi:hypothetical protein